MTRTAVVICPGRGTYNATELGYLQRHHATRSALLDRLDTRRAALGQTTLRDLDTAPKFDAGVHTRGDNASALIYAAAYCDACAISDAFDLVAVTGNSMGWYIALAVAGATTPEDGFEIVNTMGTLMQQSLIGGQSLYPFVQEDWRRAPGLRERLLAHVAEIDALPDHDLAVSIHLGGMLVVAGNEAGLRAFEKDLPKVQSRFPMRLKNHAAFHTKLQAPVSAQGLSMLPESLFRDPVLPMVDGQGKVWFPRCDPAGALRDYTLGQQVVTAYDFSKAVQVAARTFAPDVFILTGPGDTLGGAVAQSLIEINWKGLSCKEDFILRQQSDPVVLSMGRPEDRAKATTL